MAKTDSRKPIPFAKFKVILMEGHSLNIGIRINKLIENMDDQRGKSDIELRQICISKWVLDTEGTRELMSLDDVAIRDILLKCGVSEREVAKLTGDALKRYAVNLIGDTSVMVASEPKRTPERDVRKEETKPIAKVRNTEATAGGKSRAKFVAENVDDTLVLLLNEYISTCDAEPTKSAETLFFKIAQLKAEYMKVAVENGLTDSPKYAYIMNMIGVFESFPEFVDDPTKGNAINMGNKRKHYLALMPQIKGRANTLRGALLNFDSIEDRELTEKETASKPKMSETEARQVFVKNIVPNMLEIFMEFNKNFMSNPAQSAETLLVKLAQLKSQYLAAATLVNNAKKTNEHKIVMQCFEKILGNPNYTLCEGSESEKKAHYDVFAWDMKHKCDLIIRKLDFMTDVQD